MADVSITFLFVFCWSLTIINGQICGSANQAEIIKDCGRNITETYAAFLDFHTENLQTNCSCRLTPSESGKIHFNLISIPNLQHCFTNIDIQKDLTSPKVLHSLNCNVASLNLQTKGKSDVLSMRLSYTFRNKTRENSRNQFFYCLNISSEDHRNTFTLSCQSLFPYQKENNSPSDSEISLVLIGIVCTVLGIIVASGFGCFLFALHKRNSNKNSAQKNVGNGKLEKTDDENVKDEVDEDDGLKENPIYQSADGSQHYTYMDVTVPVNSGQLNNNCNIYHE